MKIQTRRKEWVANPADPTQVIRWVVTIGRVRITMLASWGIESRIDIIGRRWSLTLPYDHRLARRLFGYLENRHAEAEAEMEPDYRCEV